MTRKYLMVIAAVLLSVISTCDVMAAPPKQEKESTYVANFEYTPESQAAAGSVGVTFTVTSVLYQADAKDTKPWFMYPQFDNFQKAVGEDISELFIAKGFPVRGPFDSYDLIPYPDKKVVDLWLVPTIDLSLKTPEEAYSIEDIKIEVTGTMKLKIQEITTKELMWAKNIPFKFEFPCEKPGQKDLNVESIHWGEGVVGGKDVYNKKIKKQITSIKLGPTSMNEIAKGLEKQYPEIMAAISTLIDAEEMRILKEQCQELKSKKGY
ncbi:MAG: hypothetical protein ABII75_05145 [Candidatus Omnitrophota bacterium]